MTYSTNRTICQNCNEILPRAAAGRCPICRAIIGKAGATPATACHHCNGAIPRPGADRCRFCHPWRLHGRQPDHEERARS